MQAYRLAEDHRMGETIHDRQLVTGPWLLCRAGSLVVVINRVGPRRLVVATHPDGRVLYGWVDVDLIEAAAFAVE